MKLQEQQKQLIFNPDNLLMFNRNQLPLCNIIKQIKTRWFILIFTKVVFSQMGLLKLELQMRSDLVFVCFDHGVSQHYIQDLTLPFCHWSGERKEKVCACVCARARDHSAWQRTHSTGVLGLCCRKSHSHPQRTQIETRAHVLPKTVLIFLF